LADVEGFSGLALEDESEGEGEGEGVAVAVALKLANFASLLWRIFFIPYS
jgi:hypothetical protein